MLKRTLLFTLMSAMATPSLAAMTMTVNTENGATLKGVHNFVARVQSEHLVTSVEFYVGDDLRDTDESTPYQFQLDTLELGEGPVKITLAAYNSEGESVKQVLDLKVYNELDKGIDYHIDRSTELLKESKFEEAIQAGRVALKIDPQSNKARVAMARANFASGVFDLAQKFAEDAVASDPANVEARALLTAINLRKAFSASGPDSVPLIQGALKAAATNQFEILNAKADAAGEPTGDNLMPYVDTQISAHQYSRAIQALKPLYDVSQADSDIADRYIYALIRSARFSEAQTAIRLHKRFGEPSGYFYTLEALMLQYAGQPEQSEESEKEALLYDPTANYIKFAQAYLAIARSRYSVLGGVANELQTSTTAPSMAMYYRAVQAFASQNYDQAKSLFETSVLADPANYDMFIERGNQLISGVYALQLSGDQAKNQQEIAKAYFEAALAARPNSFEALTGLSVVHNLLGNAEEAISYGRGAAAAAPEYGPAHYALAAAFRATTSMDNARTAMTKGAEVDTRLAGRSTPRPEEAWQFFYLNGRIPLIPAPGN